VQTLQYYGGGALVDGVGGANKKLNHLIRKGDVYLFPDLSHYFSIKGGGGEGIRFNQQYSPSPPYKALLSSCPKIFCYLKIYTPGKQIL